MKAQRHLALILCYGALAGGIAFYLPLWQPQIGQSIALISAALIFLGCALLHETYGRLGRETNMGQQILDVRFDQVEIRDDLSWTQREVKIVRQALEAIADASRGGGGNRALNEVLAEVKVLRSLVGRLSDDEPAARLHPAGPAAPHGAPVAGAATIEGTAVRSATAPEHHLDDDAILDIVREALRDDRVEVVLQPIVSLPQRKRRYYECFSRLSSAEGTVVVPEQYLAIAEREGLITAIDNMLLFRCIQLVRRIQRTSQNVGFFCNVAGNTLQDQDFFGDFVEYLDGNPDLAPSLVFEFSQADLARIDEAAVRMLDRLKKLGCRISMDQVNDLDIDAERLAALHVSFIKVDVARLLAGEVEGRAALLDLQRKLERAGIDLIAEKIEREEVLVELLDYGIDFGQGYHLGEPKVAK